MSLQSNGYIFKPEEQPFMPGSPASPEHPFGRQLAYFLIGLFVAVNAGLQNGLTLASIELLRGDLSLSMEEGAWLQASYYMIYGCMSIYHFKLRQNFGLYPMILSVLVLALISTVMDVFLHNFSSALISRGIAGLTSNGLMLTGMFYMLQGLPTKIKPLAIVLAICIFQFGLPLGRIIVPFVFHDGEMTDVYVVQFAGVLLSVAFLWMLPLPPTITQRTLSWVDIFSLFSLIIGIGLACAFWTLAPVVWWDTYWLGYLAFFSLLFSSITLLIEMHRKEPMLLLGWISKKNMLTFTMASAVVRMLTSEQNVGAYGLLSSVGMKIFQMVEFNTVILVSSIFGMVAGLAMSNPRDIRRPVIIAFLLIAIASFWDVGQSPLTRPRQLMWTQAIMGFSALFFLGPMLVEGVIRALARGTHAIMSFSAAFGIGQIIGALSGTALTSTFIRYRTNRHLTDMLAAAPTTDPNVTNYISTLSAGKSMLTTDPAAIAGAGTGDYLAMVQQQAVVEAYNDMFLLMGCLAVLAFIMAFGGWLIRYFKKTNIIGDEIAVLMKALAARAEAAKVAGEQQSATPPSKVSKAQQM